ncbi:MAG: IMP dehydrogenase, partial [Anaerolineaceae bacterium]|nr:IMP dehydrogenase [Anaerolineaceae bacterium]
MKLRVDPGLTFDDVLLVPKRSAIRSRKDVSTQAWLAKGIRLHIPVVSANMDTVTEARMAIAMAQQGGIGILHRFMSVEKQVESVRRVKRDENMVVEHPLNISPDSTVQQARNKMGDADVGGLVVLDENQRLLGVVTTRDVMLAENQQALVREVMTPRERLVTAGPGESMAQAREKLYKHRIEKLPLVDSDDKV